MDLFRFYPEEFPGGIHPVGTEGGVESGFYVERRPVFDFPGGDTIEWQGHPRGIQISHPALDVVSVGHSYLDHPGHGGVGEDVDDVGHGTFPGGTSGVAPILSHLRQVNGQVVGEPPVPG